MAGLAFVYIGCGDSHQKRVYFGNLEDGSILESPFKVEMKAENLIVEPASLGVNEGHGHFHIIIDANMTPTGQVIPKDEQHIHYGQGQTEDILDLPVGQHILVLQFATGDHIPYDPQVTQRIQINVTKQNPKPAVDSTKAGKDSAGTDSLAAPAAAPKDSAAAKP